MTRLCTDGTRAGFALGYSRIGTYTLPSEGGASLQTSGWKLIGERRSGCCSSPSHPRVDKHPTEPKFLWELSVCPSQTPSLLLSPPV
ncbi:XF1762 family protein [Zavarzinella formosa]|uniref:XF1762 family protein n=1 Tax=Zavarzinella formosa TaxID=360055 RepID=UPI0036F25D6E